MPASTKSIFFTHGAKSEVTITPMEQKPPLFSAQNPSNVPALRVVLDTNIWIDILVFDDPQARPIRMALERGVLCALIDARCLSELARVLDYPQFAPRNIDKTVALATVARLSQQVPALVESAKPLPQCQDRDDQKFLELAHASGAAWLVSKDRAVLRLAKRTVRDFGFQIARPDVFNTLCKLDKLDAP